MAKKRQTPKKQSAPVTGKSGPVERPSPSRATGNGKAGSAPAIAAGPVTTRTATDRSAARSATARPQGTAATAASGPLHWLDFAVFAGVLLLIVLTPYFRGLFFPGEQMTALLVALGLFALRWAVKFSRNDYSFLRTPLDWAMLALTLAFVISTFFAANIRAAIQEDIQYFLYFIVFWLVRELTRDAAVAGSPAWASAINPRMAVLGAVAVTGAWLAVLGVGAAAGTFNYNGAFDGQRIYSALQYPNTLASYLTAALICALALWVRAGAPAWGAATGSGWMQRLRSAWPTFVIAAAAYAIFFTFVFTYSRGGWLVFPLAFALFVFLLPRGSRLPAIMMLAAVAAAFAPGMRPFAAAVAAKQAGGAWQAFLLGLPIILILNAVVIEAARLLHGLAARIRLAVIVGCGVLLAMGTWLGVNGGDLLSGDLVGKIRAFAVDSGSLSRIQWMKEAMKIVADYPLFGTGGGGWNAVYHKYQSYGYWSTEVHSHPFQVWVESGTVGMLAFVAVWVLILWSAWRLFQATRDNVALGAVIAGATAAAIGLGLHSTIDFNLSLSAVTLTLWAMAGVLAGLTATAPAGAGGRMSARGGAEYSLWPRVVVYGVVLALFAGDAALLAGFRYSQKGVAAMDAQRAEEARELYTRAAELDPFTASFQVDLGLLSPVATFAGPGSFASSEAGLRLRRGIALDPHNADLHAIYGMYALQTGSVDEGLTHLEEAVDLNPYMAALYEQLGSVRVSAAKWHLVNGRRGEGEALLQKALALRGELKKRSQAAQDWVPPIHQTPERTPMLALAWGEAEAISGNWKVAEEELRTSLDGGLENRAKAEAQVWLSHVLAKQGRQKESEEALEKAKSISTDWEKMNAEASALLPAKK